jgi:hypothetical protein
MLDWARRGFHKKLIRTSYAEHVFCFMWDLRVTYCLPGAVSIKSSSGQVTLNMCFASCGICGSRSVFRCVRGAKHQRTIFMLGWAWCGFDKKLIRTSYAEHVFLHHVGSMGHVVLVQSGASGL